ncbi:MAG: dienelactone hydrolase family protein [Chloroherpetonaceae bacterium]|nr:dienelactone hydrolase family protein [Chloroherpetonaceae bacterium]
MKTLILLALLVHTAMPLQAKIVTKTVTYKSGDEDVSAYLAMPEAKGKYPAVIMIHEWWGLNDWIKDMANALASEGYVVLAVNLYRGKVATKPDEAGALMSGLPKDRAARDLKSAYAYLQTLPEVNTAKIGSIGWCMGGSYSLLAARELGEKLAACVINYGRLSSDKNELATVKASVLGIFGGQDRGIPIESVRAFETALKELGRSVEIKIYDDSGHAFMNPNNTRGYNKANAEDAWRRTLEFFKKTLKG